MGFLRNHKSTLSQKSFSQSNRSTRSGNVISLSQPVPSTSRNMRFSHESEEFSSNRMITEEHDEHDELVNSLIKYLLVSDKNKQIVSKAHLIKNVFVTGGKPFHQTMIKAKTILSKVFGFQLIELQGNKYILVNEIRNDLPHIRPTRTEGSQQVLLFLVLTHIFMCQESCSEESLWNFLTNLDIPCTDNHHHSYFGNVKHLITEVFVTQKYLDKLLTNTNDSTQVEYKWGPRAEYEFSRRAALEFVSQMYCGRPVKSWPLQFKTLQAREKANKSR